MHQDVLRHRSSTSACCQDDHAQTTCLTGTALDKYLWLTLTRGLSNTEPSRRLKPLTAATDESWEESDICQAVEQHDPYPSFTDEFVLEGDIEATASSQYVDPLHDDATFSGTQNEGDVDEILFDLYNAYQEQRPSETGMCQNRLRSLKVFHENRLGMGHGEEEPLLYFVPKSVSSSDGIIPYSSSHTAEYTAQSNAQCVDNMSSNVDLESNSSGRSREDARSNDSFDALCVASLIGGPCRLTDLGVRLLPLPERLNHLPCVQSTSPRTLHELGGGDIWLEALPEGLSSLSVQDGESNLDCEFSLSRSQNLPGSPTFDGSAMDSSPSQDNYSLSALLSDDHLMWHMWQRRTSVAPLPDDAIELHDMFAEDPDMKLIGGSRRASKPLHTLQNIGDDEEMLEAEYSTNGTNSPTSPPSESSTMYADPFIPSTRKSAERPTSSCSARPAPPSRLSRGQSFLKRLSLSSRSSAGAGSTSDIDMQQMEEFLNDKRRPLEIKARKKLEDYQNGDGEVEEMILS